MKVGELIEELNKIEDKDCHVMFNAYDPINNTCVCPRKEYIADKVYQVNLYKRKNIIL